MSSILVIMSFKLVIMTAILGSITGLSPPPEHWRLVKELARR